MNDDLMTPILNSLPEYREASESLTAVKAMPLPIAKANSPAEQLADELRAKLAKGKPLNLLAGAATAMAEVDAVLVARSALTLVRTQLENQLSEIKASNPDPILTGLNSALGDLVEEVRTLAPLGEVTTEAGAIASDRTVDYKRLRSISGRYVAIRREQLRIMKAETGGDLGIQEVLFVRNLPELFPLWAPWHTHGHLVHDQANRTLTIRPPWPVPADEGIDRDHGTASRATFEKDASSTAFLHWAIEAGADLWVPTLEQYATAGEQHYDALAREHRTAVIDEHWLDPGGVDLGAPARGNTAAGRISHTARMAAR